MDAERGELAHHACVEARDRMTGQRELPRLAVAGGNSQLVIDEIELDLEGSRTARNWRGRESPGRDIKRDVPRMVLPGRERQPYLANDLGPEMQRRISVTP